MRYEVSVHWAAENFRDDIFSFRQRYPAVEFTEDPHWIPGPGSNQWPGVKISSENFAQFQAAVREFAIGSSEGLQWVEETWKWNCHTGEIRVAEFSYKQADGLVVGVDIAFET